jgi:hypothetical protein
LPFIGAEFSFLQRPVYVLIYVRILFAHQPGFLSRVFPFQDCDLSADGSEVAMAWPYSGGQ